MRKHGVFRRLQSGSEGWNFLERELLNENKKKLSQQPGFLAFVICSRENIQREKSVALTYSCFPSQEHSSPSAGSSAGSCQACPNLLIEYIIPK